MNFLRLLTIGARKDPIRTLADLIAAVSGCAAFLAQGAGYSYIRARSGLMGPRLMQDAGFGANMERCKWEGFAAIAGDLVLIVETELRPFGAVPAAVWRHAYRAALALQEVPEYRAGTGWDDRIAEFDQHLEAHLAQPARGIEALCEHGAAVLIDCAPVTEEIRALDRSMVINNVKFRCIEQVQQLRQRADWPALMASVTMVADESFRDEAGDG